MVSHFSTFPKYTLVPSKMESCYNSLMLKNKTALVVYKLFFGLLGFSAIITEIAVLIERDKFNPANFFSYFTIESNVIAAFVLLCSALAVAHRKPRVRVAYIRGAATLYMLIVGITFSLLLSGIEGVAFTAVSWDNLVLHYIMPVVLLWDWVLDPPRVRIVFKPALYWLLFPVTYVAYTLARGIFVDWYPYPFLDPGVKSYGQVAATITSLLIMGAIITWLLTRVPKQK